MVVKSTVVLVGRLPEPISAGRILTYCMCAHLVPSSTPGYATEDLHKQMKKGINKFAKEYQRNIFAIIESVWTP